jgi:hypothetical protein
MDWQSVLQGGPWALMLVVMGWAWKREQRMSRELNKQATSTETRIEALETGAIKQQEKYDGLEREYRGALQTSLNRCLDMMTLNAKQAHESARMLSRIRCVRPMEDCPIETERAQ